MNIIIRIISFVLGGFNRFFWKPFKSLFITTAIGTGCFEYGKILSMQEYMTVEDMEVRITKFQSWIYWLMNWNIWGYFTTFVNNLSYTFHVSKLFIVVILTAFICYFFIKIFLLIKNYFLPEKQLLQKQGLEMLQAIAEFDEQKYKSSDKDLKKKLLDAEIKLKDLEIKNSFPNKALEQEKIIVELKRQNDNLVAALEKKMKQNEKL